MTEIRVSFAPLVMTTFGVAGYYGDWVYVYGAYGPVGYNIRTGETLIRSTVGKNFPNNPEPRFLMVGDCWQSVHNMAVRGDRLFHDFYNLGGCTAEGTLLGNIHIYALPALEWIGQIEPLSSDGTLIGRAEAFAQAIRDHDPNASEQLDIGGVTFTFQQAGVSGFTLTPSGDLPGLPVQPPVPPPGPPAPPPPAPGPVGPAPCPPGYERSFLDGRCYPVGMFTTPPPPPPPPPAPERYVIGLLANRFRVEATFDTGDGPNRARAVALNDTTGYFWFFDPSNVEVIVKVLDGRGVNGRFWVFAAGLTDVGVNLTVTDTRSDPGIERHYVNLRGTPFAPIQDTSAFAG